MLRGLDVKAASMYGRKLRKSLNKNYGIRVLFKVSGWKANDGMIKWAGKNKLPFVVIDLVWRDNHKFGLREEKIAVKRARKVNRLIKKYKATKFYICPFLEPQGLSVEDYERVIRRCRKNLPENVLMVSNAMEGYRVAGAIRAGHHSWYKKGMEIFSFDGLCCKDADLNKYKKTAKDAKMFLLWSWSMNGKYSKKDKRLRKNRTSYPEIKEIQSIQAMFENGFNANLPSTWIYKPFAEQYSPPIPRGNKPVWVVPIKASHIELKWNGKAIFRFAYEKKYPHGDGFLYRSLTWPIDILKEVKKYNPSGLAEVWINEQKVGLIHPCQRVD